MALQVQVSRFSSDVQSSGKHAFRTQPAFYGIGHGVPYGLQIILYIWLGFEHIVAESYVLIHTVCLDVGKMVVRIYFGGYHGRFPDYAERASAQAVGSVFGDTFPVFEYFEIESIGVLDVRIGKVKHYFRVGTQYLFQNGIRAVPSPGMR